VLCLAGCPRGSHWQNLPWTRSAVHSQTVDVLAGTLSKHQSLRLSVVGTHSHAVPRPFQACRRMGNAVVLAVPLEHPRFKFVRLYSSVVHLRNA